MSDKSTTYNGYELQRAKWRYSQQVYDGSAFEYGEGLNDGSNGSEILNSAQYYIPKKEQRESDEQYKERLKLIDPATYFATGADSLVGTVSTSESEDIRTFTDDKGRGLGDPTDPSSLAYQFINDSNGNGLNWEFVPKEAGIKLVIKHNVYVLVEGVSRNSEDEQIGGSKVHIIDPEAVINKLYKNGSLVAVRVKEIRDVRTSMDSKESNVECFIDYELDGWKRWRYDENGGKIPVGDNPEGTYSYWRTRERKEKILPIFEVRLPLDRPVGYIWAKKCLAIANLESALDHAYRNTSFAFFSPAMSKTQYDEFKENYKKGFNSARVDPESKQAHSFIAPPSGHFDSMKAYIEQKIKNFFYNMFKDYGDVAKERTAAEIRLESQTGIEAFLVLLAGQLDEMENQVFWRLEQANFPDSPENWGIAKVHRSNDFNSVNVDEVLNNLQARYLGSRSIPLTKNGWVEFLSKAYLLSDITVPNRDELEVLADSLIAGNTQERSLLEEFGV